MNRLRGKTLTEREAHLVELSRLDTLDHVVATLEQYEALTRFSVEVEGADDNPDWDNGFNAALALVKGETE